MLYYYFDRGLSVVEHLAELFKHKKWFIPELICDEVLEKIKDHVKDYEFYNIDYDFSWAAMILGDEPKVFYVIDYFGREFRLGGPSAPPNTTVIRDSVWLPFPFAPVEHNQIWFNSLRKIIRGAKGASVVSPYRLGNNEVNNVYFHHTLTWQEIDTRFRNFYFTKNLLNEYAIPGFVPDFPTVLPICLKDRDAVLERAGLTGQLPGMWVGSNGMSLKHRYYKQLTFIPIDSRFNEDQLAERAHKIKDAING